MAQGDLTSLANVKGWLGITSTTQDPLLSRLITAASGFVSRWISRPNIGSTTYSERYDGNGRSTIVLRNGPVTGITSILYDGASITTPASGNPPTGGWLLDTSSNVARVTITDDQFGYGLQSILVTYTAGFLKASEAHAAATTVTPTFTWYSDSGVTYANGTALTAVASAPTTGQYAVSNGVYIFAAGDVGAQVLISYGYVPPDLESAVIELVGERYRALDRIGIVAKTLAGQEVISYSQADMGKAIRMMLMPFVRTAPI